MSISKKDPRCRLKKYDGNVIENEQDIKFYFEKVRKNEC